MLDDIDDARHNPAIIHPRHTMRQREKWLYLAHLHLAQQKRNIHRHRLLHAAFESANHAPRK
jgi:hypothetical protein